MTVNLYKGLNKTTGGTGLSQLTNYLQANRQMDQQQEQFDRSQQLNEDKFAAERDDVRFNRHKQQLQSDLSRINMAAGESGFANAEEFLNSEKGFQFAMKDGTFSRAMMPELYNRPDVDPESEPEFIQLENGRFGVKVKRKDGGEGVITQDGSSNPDSLVMEFDPSQMYQGYMSTLGEYGVTDVGRAVGNAYQNDNNNDVNTTISLEGVGGQVQQGANTGGGGTPTDDVEADVQTPEPAINTNPVEGRPIDAPEPETAAQQSQMPGIYNKVDPSSRPVKPGEVDVTIPQPSGKGMTDIPLNEMLSHVAVNGANDEFLYLLKGFGYPDEYVDKVAALAKEHEFTNSAAGELRGAINNDKANFKTVYTAFRSGEISRDEFMTLQAQLERKNSGAGDRVRSWLRDAKEQVSQTINTRGQAGESGPSTFQREGAVGVTKEGVSNTWQSLKNQVTGPMAGMSKFLFGEKADGEVPDEELNGATTPLHIPLDGSAKEFITDAKRVNVGVNASGTPQTVASQFITNPKMTLSITGPKSKYTNQQKAMMLTSALTVGAKDPTAVAAQVRETMHDIMNQGGTTDAKINLLRDMLNNQRAVDIAKTKARADMNKNAFDQWEHRYDMNMKDLTAMSETLKPFYAKNDESMDAGTIESAILTGANQNAAYLGRLGYPVKNGRVDFGSEQMTAAHVQILGDMFIPAYQMHGKDIREGWGKEYFNAYGKLDSKGAPAQLVSIADAITNRPQDVASVFNALRSQGSTNPYGDLIRLMRERGTGSFEEFAASLSQ